MACVHSLHFQQRARYGRAVRWAISPKSEAQEIQATTRCGLQRLVDLQRAVSLMRLTRGPNQSTTRRSVLAAFSYRTVTTCQANAGLQILMRGTALCSRRYTSCLSSRIDSCPVGNWE